MTHKELLALQHHPGWDDGRTGYLYCRFDAIIDPTRYLRAELTWDDNSETLADDPDLPPLLDRICYYEPELLLESNYLRGNAWVTLDARIVDLNHEDVVRILSEPPQNLLKVYAEKIAKLKIFSTMRRADSGAHYFPPTVRSEVD